MRQNDRTDQRHKDRTKQRQRRRTSQRQNDRTDDPSATSLRPRQRGRTEQRPKDRTNRRPIDRTAQRQNDRLLYSSHPPMFFRDQMIGKYRILSSLGSGGFGTVYLAEDTWIDKKVALKVPHKQNLDFTDMLKEPRLLASMSHPNIVTVLTAEKQQDVFFIVMEYVAGETLEEVIVREGPLPLNRALDFTCQICNAVDHAHRAGILHRDLRPGNMLVSDTGMLKVTDFGTSRFLEIAAHGTTVIGSPPYMAPEQFHGKAVFASDVYSIGVTMYQMLTGTLPYETPAPADVERLMRGELTTPPRLKNHRIPRAIDDIVLKALAPDPTSRYQRASELLAAVLAARGPKPRPRRTGRAASVPPPHAVRENVADIRVRLRAREAPAPRFCWHCRKPLHARADRCPFCGEHQ
jgi:eukaryotic-like serine/threonine-protein kinase